MKRFTHRQHRRVESSTTNSSKDFTTIMQEATYGMPRSRRLFSTFIHTRPVASLSGIVARTIARPNALLCGAICSFVLTLSVYLLAKNYGYTLSGSEALLGFAVGWFAGTMYDLFQSILRKS